PAGPLEATRLRPPYVRAGPGATLSGRRSSGFERLGLVVVVRDPHDLAVAIFGHHGVVSCELDAAPLAPRDHLEEGDRPVFAHGPDLEILDSPALPGLIPPGQPSVEGVGPGRLRDVCVV